MPKSVTQVGKHRVKGQEDSAGCTAASLGKLIKSFGRSRLPRRWWWSQGLAPPAAGPHAQHPEQQGKAPGSLLMSFVLARHMCGACGMLGKTTKGLWCFLPSILVFNAGLVLGFFFLGLLLKCPQTMRLLSIYYSMRLGWVSVSAEPAHFFLPHSYRNRC